MKDCSEDMSLCGRSDATLSRGACLAVKDASWNAPRSRRTVLHPISFDLSPGQVLGIVGPNGAGKSTLLRLLYRYHCPASGTVKIDNNDIWKLSARDTARKVAAVLQEQGRPANGRYRYCTGCSCWPTRPSLPRQIQKLIFINRALTFC